MSFEFSSVLFLLRLLGVIWRNFAQICGCALFSIRQVLLFLLHHLNLVDLFITGFFGRSCLFPVSFRGLVISSRWLWSGVSAAAPFTPLAVRQYSLSDLIFFLW